MGSMKAASARPRSSTVPAGVRCSGRIHRDGGARFLQERTLLTGGYRLSPDAFPFVLRGPGAQLSAI